VRTTRALITTRWAWGPPCAQAPSTPRPFRREADRPPPDPQVDRAEAPKRLAVAA